MVEFVRKRKVEQGWWVRHAEPLKSVFRMLFGVIWLIDGALKFSSGFVNSFPTAVATAQSNSPAWLSGWYSFWLGQANSHASLIVYTVGGLELLLGVVLLAGFMRKLSYVGGTLLSLLIWAVPEGFGGPYAGGTGGTDVGAGVVYALLFLALITLNSSFGPSRWSLDYFIERRWPRWAMLAEFRRLEPREDPESVTVGPNRSGSS